MYLRTARILDLLTHANWSEWPVQADTCYLSDLLANCQCKFNVTCDVICFMSGVLSASGCGRAASAPGTMSRHDESATIFVTWLILQSKNTRMINAYVVNWYCRCRHCLFSLQVESLSSVISMVIIWAEALSLSQYTWQAKHFQMPRSNPVASWRKTTSMDVLPGETVQMFDSLGVI